MAPLSRLGEVDPSGRQGHEAQRDTSMAPGLVKLRKKSGDSFHRMNLEPRLLGFP